MLSPNPIPISVITPSLNQGAFIEETIQSVLSQDVPNLEYMVIDGGSDDETIQVLKKFEGKIKWISEEDNGQAHAVNKGINATSGEIIGWLNSDDIYYPGALKTVLSYFQANPDIDVVYGDADHIDENNNIIEAYPTEKWNYNRLTESCFLCQPAVFFRRHVVEKAGTLDERLHFCMDYEYWLRVGNIFSFKKIPFTLAGSRLYPKNKTLGSRVAAHREINDMLLKRTGTVPINWIYNYARVVSENRNFKNFEIAVNPFYVICLLWIFVKAYYHWRNTNVNENDLTMTTKWIKQKLFSNEFT